MAFDVKKFVGEVQVLTSREMQTVSGGEEDKKILSIQLKSDGMGTYWEIIYTDGTVETIDHTWYA